MKTLLKDLAVFLLILVLGITGCAAPAIQPPPTQPASPRSKMQRQSIRFQMWC